MNPIHLTIAGMPLGHPGEIALATVELAEHCDFVLCESKRAAQTHFKRAGLEIPDERFVVFDKKTRPVIFEEFLDELLQLSLKKPVQLMLVSDAGMPSMEDPGSRWIQIAEENGFKIHMIGGPTAITSALVRAGLNGPFCFGGFPPREKKERQFFFKEASRHSVPFGFYEAPHRVPDIATELKGNLAPGKSLFVAVALGSDQERIIRVSAGELSSLRLPKLPAVFLIYSKKPLDGRSARP